MFKSGADAGEGHVGVALDHLDDVGDGDGHGTDQDEQGQEIGDKRLLLVLLDQSSQHHLTAKCSQRPRTHEP